MTPFSKTVDLQQKLTLLKVDIKKAFLRLKLMFQNVDLQKKGHQMIFESIKLFSCIQICLQKIFSGRGDIIAGVTPFKIPPRVSPLLVMMPLHYTTVLVQLVEAQQGQSNCCIKKAKHWSICKFFGRLYGYLLRKYYERNFLSCS